MFGSHGTRHRFCDHRAEKTGRQDNKRPQKQLGSPEIAKIA
jgi:hypothetical protein